MSERQYDMPVCSMDFGRKIGNNNYVLRKSQGNHHRPYWDNSQWMFYTLVGMAAVGCYVNSLWGEFVHDDIPAIVKNADVRGDTDIFTVFQNDFWGKTMTDNTSHKSYRPLTVLTFRLNYMVSGHNPFSYHLVNVILHLMVSLLFTMVCEVFVFKSIMLSTLAGTLFAVHPIHTEAVSGIVGRADVLCAVFFLLSFLTFLGSRKMIALGQHPTVARCLFLCTLMLAGCAMLAKEQGITVLGVCFFIELFLLRIYYRARRYGRRRQTLTLVCSRSLILLLCLILAGILFLYIRMLIQRWKLPTFTDQDNPAAFSSSLLTQLLTYSYLPVLNMWLLICPARLSYDYQLNAVPLLTSYADWRNVGTLLIFVILFQLSSKVLSQQDSIQQQIAVGLLFMVLPFLPASNLFYPVGFVVAERILYIPSMGFIIIVVTGIKHVLHICPHTQRLQWVTVIALCLVLAGRTVTRNRVWQNRERLFRSGLVDSPHNAKMYYNYANFLKDQGRFIASREFYRTAISIWPTYASAYNNLGTLVTNHSEAEKLYREALRIIPCHPNANLNLGTLLWKQSRKVEAIGSLKAAMNCDTLSVTAHYILATIYIELGLNDNAEETYQDAIRRYPNDANAYTHYAEFLRQKGAYMDALAFIKQAMHYDPSNHITLRVAGRLMVHVGREEEACILFKRALAVSEDPVTLDMAGEFFLKTGNLEKAIYLYQKAYKAEPKLGAYGIHLAQSLNEATRYNDAKDVLIDILEARRAYFDAAFMLANIYGNMQQHEKAIVILEDNLPHVDNNRTAALFYLNLGKHYRDVDNLDLAFYHYQQAVLHDSELGEAHHNLGVFYHMQGNLERAREHYQYAKAIQPENIVLQKNMAKLSRVVNFRKQSPVSRPCSDFISYETDTKKLAVNQYASTFATTSVSKTSLDKLNRTPVPGSIVSPTLFLTDIDTSLNSTDSKHQILNNEIYKTLFVDKTL